MTIQIVYSPPFSKRGYNIYEYMGIGKAETDYWPKSFYTIEWKTCNVFVFTQYKTPHLKTCNDLAISLGALFQNELAVAVVNIL